MKGKTVSLEGHFTSSGLRRIFSTFDRPPAFQAAKAEQPSESSSQSTEQRKAEATLTYFKGVQELLRDLKGQKSRSGGTYTTGSIAKWCTNYSRKINNLPMLNVDPEMIEFGTKTAQTLVQVAQSLNGGNIQGGIAARSASPVVDTYTSSNVYGYGYRGGWFGGGIEPLGSETSVSVIDERATTAQRANIRSNARAQSSQQARQIFASIDAAMADICARMVQKYQIEF